VRLDDYLAERGITPDFVKIDVESAEIYVLRGMENLLATTRPAVSVETGDYAWTGAGDTRECIRFLLDRGYRCFFQHKDRSPGGPGHPARARPICAIGAVFCRG
jgi:hypothetical protein